MDIVVLLFLTSGLFLGWSLGANDAANVFGTAVGTGMVRFVTAAMVCSVFLLLGAVISGAGAAHTLGKLGSVNALAGSFAAAFSAALTVYWMTKAGLPVSTSQAIVGAIIGWNWFSGSITDAGALAKILATWVACPLLAGFIAVPLFHVTTRVIKRAGIHLLRLDAYTRAALILAGAFGSYSLGANNIANVMGVFVPVSPFTDFSVAGLFTFSSIQQLFLLGAVAIGVGVFTYSKRVMLTVGSDLLPLSPVAAWVVVMSHSIVLFLFASEGLEHLLASAGLPTIPLVPVSSSQAVVGAVVGIGLFKGGRNIQWRVLGTISGGWITTPIIAACVSFLSLFVLQNVFDQQVYRAVHFELSPTVMERLVTHGVSVEDLRDLRGTDFPAATRLLDAVKERTSLSGYQQNDLLATAEVFRTSFDPAHMASIDKDSLSADQLGAIHSLAGQTYRHKWQVSEKLAQASAEWQLHEETTVNKIYNKRVKSQMAQVFRTFGIEN
ncbi:MAG: inorganic phosphate transporter [Rhodospirillales bacterium]|jgi:inorganic phosphate transporter, PiT family|nr:inorganic phosphate transporter [Rhodospirillales bacterium]